MDNFFVFIDGDVLEPSDRSSSSKREGTNTNIGTNGIPSDQSSDGRQPQPPANIPQPLLGLNPRRIATRIGAGFIAGFAGFGVDHLHGGDFGDLGHNGDSGKKLQFRKYNWT